MEDLQRKLGNAEDKNEAQQKYMEELQEKLAEARREAEAWRRQLSVSSQIDQSHADAAKVTDNG